MWYKSENSNNIKPPDRELNGKTLYLRREFKLIPAQTGEMERPEHWEYEENAFNTDLAELYQGMDEVNDALVELAELIVGG